MEKCCKDAASKFNTTYTFEHSMSYPSFELSRDSHVFKLSERSARRILNKIVNAGLGRICAKETSIGGGRPKNITEILF